MKTAVCVKQALDETELKVDPSGVPVIQGAAMKMSVFDKNAVEESVRIRGASGGEVCVFTVGPPDAKRPVKEALAMGADRAVLVLADTASTDAMGTAALLSGAIKKEGPFDLVVCSEGSSDTYSGSVPAMLAELLGLPFVGYVRKLEINGRLAKLERSLEETLEVMESELPVVVSVVSEINEPRYPTLIQIMQASKKPIVEAKPEELPGGMPPSRVAVSSLRAQAMSRKHVVFEGDPKEATRKLLDALVGEGLVKR